MGDPQETIRAVVTVWQADRDLCRDAAAGFMGKVGPKGALDRREVCANYRMLSPVVQHFGPFLSVHASSSLRPALRPATGHQHHCRGGSALLELLPSPWQNFTRMSDPQWIPTCRDSGKEIMAEACVIRNLVFVFARAARRGHRPREPQMRELMTAAGITVPDATPQRAAAEKSANDDHANEGRTPRSFSPKIPKSPRHGRSGG